MIQLLLYLNDGKSIGINVLLFKKYNGLLAFTFIYFGNTKLRTNDKYAVFKSKDELIHDGFVHGIITELFYFMPVVYKCASVL